MQINEPLAGDDKQKAPCCTRRRLKIAIIMTGSVVLVLSLAAVILFSVEGYPLHASCKITWQFPSVSCQNVSEKLVAQAKAWETADNCANGGEKCLYTISSHNPGVQISGTHKTPVKKYVDDITYTLKTSGAGCSVEGNSRSETWYAYLDEGTNYCNIHNLVTGAGLDASSGYSETTSDDVCTQFSSADCTKY